MQDSKVTAENRDDSHKRFNYVDAIIPKPKGELSGSTISMGAVDVHLEGPDDMRAFAEAFGGGGGSWAEGYPEKYFADDANGTEGGGQ